MIEYEFEESNNSIHGLATYVSKNNVELLCMDLKNKTGQLSNTNLIMKCRIANEIAFLFYTAVSDFHSLSYGNYKQENRTENEQV